MKVLKVLLFVLAGLVLLAALAAGLAFVPGVQRWALHRAVAGVPGLTLHADRVLVRPSRIELDGLALTARGTAVNVPALRAEVDLWRFWRRGELVVARIEARGFDIAFAPTDETPAAAPTPAARAPFPGFLAPARLPFPLTVGKAVLDGKFRFAGPGGATAPAAQLALEGGGLAPGGKFEGTLQATVERPVPGSDVARLTFDGRFAAGESADLRIESLTLSALIAAQGENLPAERQLQVALELAQPAAGGAESATLSIELPRPTGVAARLVTLKLKHEPARGTIDGEWRLQARRAQLADFIRGRTLPDFDGVSSGKFSFAPATGDAAGEGTVALTTGSLAGVRPELASLGALQLDATFAAARKGDVLSLSRLETSVSRGRAQILRVKSLQPAAYNVATSTVAFAEPANDLVQVEIAGLPVAWLQPFLPGVEVSGREIVGSFAVGAAADGSRLALRALQPFAVAGVTVRRAGATLIEGANLSLSPRIEHSAAGTNALVPDLTLTTPGGDRLEAHLDVRATHDAGVTTLGFAAALRTVVPTLLKGVLPANAGGLQADLTVAGALRGSELALQTAMLRAKRGNGLALAEVETRQPFTLFLDSLTVRPEKAGDPLARVAVSGVPLEWLRPWLDGWQVSGDLAGGEVLVQTDGTDNLALETVRPFAFRDLRVARDGKLYADELQGELALKARGSRERVQIDTVSMDLRRGAESFLRLAGAFSYFAGADARFEGNGRFEADAVRLLALPPLAAYATLAHGRLSGDGEFSYGAKPRAKLNLRGRELVGREGAVAWGNVGIAADVSTADDGTMTFTLPVTVDNAGRKSVLQLGGTLRTAAAPSTVSAALTADQVYLDDLRALATLARGVPEAEPAAKPAAPKGTNGTAKTETPAPPKPDAKPAWAGLTGRLDVDVKRISGEDYEISGLKTALALEPERVALEKLEGRFKDSPLSAAGALTFTAGKPEPYALQATFSFPGFDTGAFFKAVEPSRPPVLETTGTMKAELRSQGATLPATLAATKGGFELTAGKGVYRGLGRMTEKVSTAVAIGQNLLGLIGRGSEKTDSAAAAVSEIAAYLGEIPFESVVVRAQRGEDLKLAFQQFELRHPEVRLFSTAATVGWDASVPFEKQPQRFEFRLAVKGERAKRWAERGYLETQPDADGFFLFTQPIAITGTVANPNANEFYLKLGQAGVGELLKRLGN